jgi:hypothetical protein
MHGTAIRASCSRDLRRRAGVSGGGSPPEMELSVRRRARGAPAQLLWNLLRLNVLAKWSAGSSTN